VFYICGPGYLSRYSDSVRAGRSGDRIPVGARFPAPIQTGTAAYPASYTMGAGSLPGVKRPGRGIDHPPPSTAEVKERVEIYPYSWPVIGWTLPFYIRLFDVFKDEYICLVLCCSSVSLHKSHGCPLYTWYYFRGYQRHGECRFDVGRAGTVKVLLTFHRNANVSGPMLPWNLSFA